MASKRAKTLAPATLVALTVVMMVGSTGLTATSRITVGDRRQVAQLLAAVQHAAKVLNGNSVNPMAVHAMVASADVLLPPNAFNRSLLNDAARLVLPGSFTPHLIDLPPPAQRCS
jgi:hypothetical protein